MCDSTCIVLKWKHGHVAVRERDDDKLVGNYLLRIDFIIERYFPLVIESDSPYSNASARDANCYLTIQTENAYLHY